MSARAVSRRSVLAASLAVAGATRSFAASAVVPSEGMEGVVAPDAELSEVYAEGVWCEGPAWDRVAHALVFSDVRANRILRLPHGEAAAPLRDPSNNANGNGFDAQGRLLTCEHLGHRVVRQEVDRSLTVLADRFEGRRLNSPNDLAIAPDGAIWFTDPTFGITQPEEGRQAEPELPGRFVFRIDPGGRLEVASDTFEQPNGIVFSPDGLTLYVSDASAADGREGKREIRAFDVAAGGRLRNERLFAQVPSGIPDGLTVDADGRLYAATDRGATVWSADGRLLGHIVTPGTCGNLEFGGADGRTLFLCNGTSIHAVATRARGAAWR